MKLCIPKTREVVKRALELAGDLMGDLSSPGLRPEGGQLATNAVLEVRRCGRLRVAAV